MFTRVSALPGRPVPSGIRHATEGREKKRKKKKGGRKTYRVSLYIGFMPGSSTPVASLCVKEGGWPRVEIMGGTGVGDVGDVGAAGRRRRQDLVMAWLLRLLAK